MRAYFIIPFLVIVALLAGCGGGGGGASSGGSGTGSGQLKPGLLVGAYGNAGQPDLYGITQTDGTVTPTSADQFTAEVASGQPATIIGLIGSRLTKPQYGGSMTITKNAADNTYAVSLTSQSNGRLDFTYNPDDPGNGDLYNRLSFLLPGPEGVFLDILGGLPR